MTRAGSMISALAATAVAVAVCAPAHAQDLNFGALRGKDRHVLHLGAGVEDAVVTSFGYRYVLPALGRTLVVGADLDVVPVRASDRRLRVGMVAPVARSGGWIAGAKALGILRSARNDVNRMTNVGLETALSGGFYATRWFLAAEAGADWAAATYIRHTGSYRRVVYDGARDGWYASTGATLVYGLSAGYSLSSVDLVLRAGQRRDLSFATWLIPFYATVGIDVRIPGFSW